jgi:beta-lactamase class A
MRLFACVLGLSVIAPLMFSAPAAAVTLGSQVHSASTAPPPPDPAPHLAADMKALLAKRHTTASVKVRDLVTGHEYNYRSGARYDSASIVKVAIMAAVLRRQEKQKRYLTRTENRLLHKMIQNSDNDAASKLWKSLGRGPAMTGFFRAAGMKHPTPGHGGYWGLTQITAADEVVLLSHLARKSTLLTKAGRQYARGLMASVKASQRWGVSAGPAAAGARIELKNGWLSRSRRGWRIHSIGHVKGDGRDYLIAVLTMDNRHMATGIATVESVSRLVWRSLAPPPAP